MARQQTGRGRLRQSASEVNRRRLNLLRREVPALAAERMQHQPVAQKCLLHTKIVGNKRVRN